jgi:hypothetical protein
VGSIVSTRVVTRARLGRHFARVAVATVFALTLTGVVRAQETKLTVVVFQGMQNLPLFAGRSNGLFAKRGLAIGLVWVTERFASIGASPFGRRKCPYEPRIPSATIQDEMGLDTRCGDSAVRDGMIDAIDGVLAELCCQYALGVDRPRKHHQAARVLVEAVNRAELGVNARPANSSQQRLSVVHERVLIPWLVGDAEHPDRLVDDDVAVVKHDRALGKRIGTELGCPLVNGNHRTWRDTRCGVETAPAIYRDAPLSAQATRTRPCDARLLANDRRDGGLGCFQVDRALRDSYLRRS